MIIGSADRDGDAAESLNAATKKRMKARPPFRRNGRSIAFGVEYEMKMKAQVCLGHIDYTGTPCGVRSLNIITRRDASG